MSEHKHLLRVTDEGLWEAIEAAAHGARLSRNAWIVGVLSRAAGGGKGKAAHMPSPPLPASAAPAQSKPRTARDAARAAAARQAASHA